MRKHRHIIGKFIAGTKGSNKYASDRTFVDAIYRQNEDLINEKLTPTDSDFISDATPKQRFYNKFKALRQSGLSRYESLRSMALSRTFLSEHEMRMINIQESLSREDSIKIRKLSGHYKQKIEWDKFEWNEEKQMYIYSKNQRVGLMYSYPDNSETEAIVQVVDLSEEHRTKAKDKLSKVIEDATKDAPNRINKKLTQKKKKLKDLIKG